MFRRWLVVSMLCLGGLQVFGSYQTGSDGRFHTAIMWGNGVAVKELPGSNLFSMAAVRPGESVGQAYRRFQQEIQSYVPVDLEIGIFGKDRPDDRLVDLVHRSIGFLGLYDMDSMSQIELIVRQDSDNSSRILGADAKWCSAVREKGERLEAVFTARESAHGLRQRMGELDESILIARQAMREIRDRAAVEYQAGLLLARQQRKINLTTEEIERLAFEMSVLDVCKIVMISGIFEQAQEVLRERLWQVQKAYMWDSCQRIIQEVGGACIRWGIAHACAVLTLFSVVLYFSMQHEGHDDKEPLISGLQ